MMSSIESTTVETMSSIKLKPRRRGQRWRAERGGVFIGSGELVQAKRKGGRKKRLVLHAELVLIGDDEIVMLRVLPADFLLRVGSAARDELHLHLYPPHVVRVVFEIPAKAHPLLGKFDPRFVSRRLTLTAFEDQ